MAWRPVAPGTISWLLFKVVLLAIVPNIVMYLWIGSGIIAYHRLFAHRSFRCKPWLEALLLIGGGMALEGPAVRWVKVHKTHHWFADRPGDPHSPLRYGRRGDPVDGPATLKGFWWAHIGWMLFRYDLPDNAPSVRYLERRPMFRLQSKGYLALMIAAYAIPALFAGWIGGVGFGLAGLGVAALRVLLVLHVTWSINSVTHTQGDRAVDSEGREYRADDSRNVTGWLGWLLRLLTFGESAHANHHAKQDLADLRWGSVKSDPAGRVILWLERLGIVWDAKKPPARIRFSDRQLQPIAYRRNL